MNQGMICAQLDDTPCMQCLGGGSSSAFSLSHGSLSSGGFSSITFCTGNECGSDLVCANQGMTCQPLVGPPCKRCVTSFSSVGLCRGDECIIGGSIACNRQGKSCITINNRPCVQCVGGSSGGSSLGSGASSAGPVCYGDECTLGGSYACGLQGKVCVSLPTLPCASCVAKTSSSLAPSQASAASVPQCVRDAQCGTGICINGACQACVSNVQCQSGLCTRGMCRCLNDAQCITGICLNGQCSGCRNDAQCGAGGRCVNGACVASVQFQSPNPFCGNGRLDTGELCDNGRLNSAAPNAACRPDCTPGRCGDGVVDTPLEVCDDANRKDGDGCSHTCQLEHQSTTINALPASMFEIPFFGSPGTPRPNLPPRQAVLNPALAQHPPVGSTGPELLVIIAAGASAGVAWVRRRK